MEHPQTYTFLGLPVKLEVLKNGWVLCSYGYRKEPYGVRSCISKDTGNIWDIENENVIRADGTGFDLGYRVL